jgi:hypothetical protein
MEIVRKKKSRLKYNDGCILSVIVAYPVNIFQLLVKCRRTISLCKFIGDCGISTKLLWNADGNIPSVNSSVIETFAPSYYEMPTETLHRYISSVIIFKYIFKKIIYNK